MSKIVDKSNSRKQKTENNKNIYRIRVAITRIFYYNERKFYLGVFGMKLKKIAVAVGMAVVFLAGSMNVRAVNVVQVPAEEIDSVYNQSVDSNQLEGWAKGPQIYSEAGIVMDADSGAILYAKNIDDPHYPASITKRLTGLVASENNELTASVTVTPDDYNFLKRGDNHIGLKKDEQITMEDALYGTLLASGNEVAHAVASNTEGGYDNFIKLMNEKSK